MGLRNVSIITCDYCKQEGIHNKDEALDQTVGWIGWKEGFTPPLIFRNSPPASFNRQDWCSITCFVGWWREYLTKRGARSYPIGEEEEGEVST